MGSVASASLEACCVREDKRTGNLPLYEVCCLREGHKGRAERDNIEYIAAGTSPSSSGALSLEAMDISELDARERELLAFTGASLELELLETAPLGAVVLPELELLETAPLGAVVEAAIAAACRSQLDDDAVSVVSIFSDTSAGSVGSEGEAAALSAVPALQAPPAVPSCSRRNFAQRLTSPEASVERLCGDDLLERLEAPAAEGWTRSSRNGAPGASLQLQRRAWSSRSPVPQRRSSERVPASRRAVADWLASPVPVEKRRCPAVSPPDLSLRLGASRGRGVEPMDLAEKIELFAQGTWPAAKSRTRSSSESGSSAEYEGSRSFFSCSVDERVQKASSSKPYMECEAAEPYMECEAAKLGGSESQQRTHVKILHVASPSRGARRGRRGAVVAL